MQAAMKVKHVVVDGSNIATEGRDAPRLAPLDEAERTELHALLSKITAELPQPSR